MIKNLIFGVYLLISDFLVESLKTKKKLAKKITHFTTQFRSKNLYSIQQHSRKHDAS